MFDSLAKMFSGGLDSLLGGGAQYSPMMGEAMGVTPEIWAGANPLEQKGIMDSFSGLGFDGGQNGLAGMFKNTDLMDLGKLGFGYAGMQEQKKNNKLNRKLTQQNIDENGRITDGREKAADIFNNPSSGLAAYGSSTVG